jgi:hypothetical protein
LRAVLASSKLTLRRAPSLCSATIHTPFAISHFLRDFLYCDD